MPTLKLVPLPTGQVVVRAQRWVQTFCFVLLGYGLVTLHTDLSRPRGLCCTRLYYSHDAAIEYSALWCLMALLLAISITQKITLRGGVLRASWLGGVLRCTRLIERVEVHEVEMRSRGETSCALRLKLGWLPLYVLPDFDGYSQLRRSLRAAPDWPE